MDEPFIGLIGLFGFNFPPRGWAQCQGQLMPISEFTALFALLGTTYGGDGQTTFALPDLRGRVPVGQGQGPGLSSYSMGEQSGTESVTLIQVQMPMHNHTVSANSAVGDTGAPQNAAFANTGATDREYLASGIANVIMSPSALGISGGSQPHANLMPYLALNYSIALEGIFPSRN